MNVERLKALINLVLRAESVSKTAAALQTVTQAYTSLQQNATHPQVQQQAASARDAFDKSAEKLRDTLSSPEGLEAVYALQLKEWTISIQAEIDQLIQQNSGLPSVMAQRLTQLANDRNNIFTNLKIMNDTLDRVGVDEDKPAPGEVQLGLSIPRDLFSNTVGGLSEELRQLDRVFNAYSVLSDIGAEPIEVGSITTTNPIIFFHMHVDLINHIVDGFKFAIQVVNATSSMRRALDKVRGILDKNAAVAASEKIESEMRDQIREHATHQAEANEKLTEADRHDLITRISDAIRLLCDQVEGGVTIQIRSDASGTEPNGLSQKEISIILDKVSNIQYPNIPNEDRPRIEGPKDS